MSINIKGLQLFDLVVGCGSLAEAARQMNLSQSAASRQILELEHAVKLQLFFRTNRNLRPTPEGLRFHAETQQLLSGINEIPAIVENIKTTTASALSVVVMPRVALGLVTPVVSTFQAAHPSTRVHIQMLRRFDIQRWSAAREFDIGFGTLPVTDRSLDSKVMFDARACVFLRRDHPLAARDEINVADLAGERLIGFTPGLQAREQMDDLIRSTGRTIPYAMEVSSALLATRLVAEGAGICILDVPSVHQLCPMDDFRLIPVRPLRWWPMGAFWRRRAQLNPLAAAMLESVDDNVETMMQIPAFAGLMRRAPTRVT